MVYVISWDEVAVFSRWHKNSREVQVRISFGLTCCHVLLEVNLYFEFKVTKAHGQFLAR
jgi:hypothetical protein